MDHVKRVLMEPNVKQEHVLGQQQNIKVLINVKNINQHVFIMEKLVQMHYYHVINIH